MRAKCLTDLAGGGHTGVESAGSPGLVPGTGGDHLVVLPASLPALEVAVGPAGVGDGGEILKAAAPLPGPRRGSGRWGGAVHSCAG